MAERGAGLAFAGIFGAAFVSIMSGGTPSLRQAQPSASPAQTVTAATTARPGAAPSSRLVTGDSLVREFLGEPGPPAATLAKRGAHQRHVYSLDVLIATVPDPVDSRLDWAFDSYLASVRRAHERTGYVIDRFWLPWGSVPDTLRTESGARVREEYPGALLFRRLAGNTVQLSLVYVVGEVPTRGVHRPALKRALDERRQLLRAFARPGNPGSRPTSRAAGRTVQGPVKIVGPAFSGSSLSLRAALDAGGDSAIIISGSATNRDNLSILQDSSPGPGGRKRITFRATVHSDEAFLRALEARIFDPLGIRRDQVAILLENSTGYGQNALDEIIQAGSGRGGTPRDSARYLVVPFPMNISRLRSEYARRPVSAPAAPVAGAGAVAPIPVDMSDPGRPLESPPVLSSLTVPALETQLAEIGTALTRRRVRAAVILASDVRDKMFLAAELRRRVRDVQVFTFEGNALFLAPDRNRDLRGMVVVSTYPLFLRNQWWTAGPRDRERLVFPNEGAQGVYNATLLQLDSASLVSEYLPPASHHGSSPRAGDGARPPVWITAVGAGAFMPLAVHTEASDTAYLAAAGVAGPGAVHDGRVSLFLRVGVLVLSLALLELARRAVVHSLGTAAFGRISPPRQAGAAQTVRCVSLRIHGHLYRMLALATVLAVWMPVVVVFLRSQPRHYWYYDLPAAVLLATAAGAMLVATRGVIVLVWKHRKAGRDFALGSHWGTAGRQVAWGVEILARTVVAVMGLFFVVLAVRYAWEMSRIGEPGLRLYLHRVSRVDAGVTPLVPLLLGALVLGQWCTWHLRRVRNLSFVTMFEAACLALWDRNANDRIGEWKPRVAERRSARQTSWARSVAGDWWERLRAKADRRQHHPLRAPRLLDEDTIAHVVEVRNRVSLTVPNPAGLLLLAGVLLLASALWGTMRHTLERAAHTPTFDVLLSFSIVGSLATTTWAVYRLLAIWRALRRVLGDMGTTPLLTAFDRLPRETSRLTRMSLVGAPGRDIVTSVRAAQWRQMVSIAQNLADPPPDADGKAVVMKEAEEEARWSEIQQLKPGEESGRARCESFEAEGRHFQELERLLGDLWKSEPTPEQVWTVSGALREMSLWEDGARPDTGIMLRRSVPGRLRLWVRAAEEFAAVQVVDYIEWVLQHMRTLTWFLFLSLLLSTALISSYPFEPQRTAKLVLALVLVGTVGTLLYVMTDMNRDEVLSRIAKTDPGRVTWDGAYLANISLIAVVPVLTLISSEVPPLREFLFSWMDPVFRLLVR
ncbi:hypothetical protein [Longimicrobium sp.]|jgi:hypothetical protein|uniref:hypothetical protein n=1 Tax=Longimicrobium sp. TaxID=2029185 RepID=UPI002F9427DD